jgi:hypothetical protein
VTRKELEHAIRAACDVADETEVYVFGSQAILGQFPDASAALRMSAEADIAPKNFPERADVIDGALGELSMFHDTHGFYVHGLDISAATLPAGWEQRAIRVQTSATRQNIGWCLEGHDLAASKLAAFRDKDREFVRVLIAERMVSPKEVAKRIRMLPTENKKRLLTWVKMTAEEVGTHDDKR